MPNYKYVCIDCAHESFVTLPMSSDPRSVFVCEECQGAMNRRIARSNFQMERETLGKWYKENTGKDLLGE